MLPKNITPCLDTKLMPNSDLFAAAIIFCTRHKLMTVSFHKTLYTLFNYYQSTRTAYSGTLKDLAKMARVSLSRLNHVMHILRTKLIIKKRGSRLHIIERRDTSRVFLKESVPQIFFNAPLRSLRRYLRRHTTYLGETSSNISITTASSPPFGAVPQAAPKGFSAAGTDETITNRGPSDGDLRDKGLGLQFLKQIREMLGKKNC